MHFDVSKFVRSPGCDHGHDEESRNGRDIKIDILDDYIRSLERFRVIRVFFGVPESYGNSPGGIWALVGLSGREERWPEMRRAPLPPLVRIGQGEGAVHPLSFPPSADPIPTRIGGGILLPEGVGLLLARPIMAGHTPL